MTDNVIAEKIKNREEEGFSMLLDQYSRYVAVIILNITKGVLSAEDVEEAAADVFISLWNSADRIRESSALKPYLAQIARNTAIDRLRKCGKEMLTYDDDILVVATEGIPDEKAMQNEQQDIINEAVNRFPDPEKEIFVRFYYLGEQVKQIAQKLSLNPATVKTKLHRSRKEIKAVFEARGYRYEN